MSPATPRGWVVARVDSLAAFVRGVTYTKTEARVAAEKGLVPVLRAGNLQDDAIVWDDLVFVPERFVSDAQRIRAGDIVVAMSSGSASVVGKAAPVREHDDHRGAGFGAFCGVWRPKDHDWSPWLQQYFRSPEYRGKVFAAALGVNINNLRADHIGGLEIPVPPLNEQRRIVAKLEALQARSRRAREALEAVPPLLQKLRQSILASAFRGDLTKAWRAKNPDVEPASELLKRIRAERRKKWEEAELAKMKAKGRRPADDKWKAKYDEPAPVDSTGLPELPETWCWASWRQVGFCQNGRAFPSSEYSGVGTKLLRPGNLNVSGELEWTEQNTRRMPPLWEDDYPDFIVGANELVMNLTAQSLKDEFLGRICLSGHAEKCLLNQRLARLTPVVLPPEYWLWFFKSPVFRRYVDTLNTGSLIQHMFTSQVDTCPVPLMPAAEAGALTGIVAARLTSLQAVQSMVATESARVPMLERSALATAFRGELVPQEPNDERDSTALKNVDTPGDQKGRPECIR